MRRMERSTTFGGFGFVGHRVRADRSLAWVFDMFYTLIGGQGKP